MIELILAATIASSIQTAIEKTEQENPQRLEARVTALEERLSTDERIAVNTWKCFNRTLIGGGIDLGSTALGLATRDDLKESNPLGFNTESRIALKFAQVGTTGWGCYILEKSGHRKTAKILSWTSLLGQIGFAVNNLILTLKH